MIYLCRAPGCDKSAIDNTEGEWSDAPWAFEFCSRECWSTVDIVDHLRAEPDMLCQIAAEEIRYLWEKNEKLLEEIQGYAEDDAGASL